MRTLKKIGGLIFMKLGSFETAHFKGRLCQRLYDEIEFFFCES